MKAIGNELIDAVAIYIGTGKKVLLYNGSSTTGEALLKSIKQKLA